ncbi:phosphoenolpyruvate carboxykinase [Dictyocaulus viviparus]|uniref:phosphoenolpyruvate carboxykinase (GTP) n=1 Tax=Dictyocaulus viviparus TaxID=29172 RepID=A0A0D8XF92_DICVI|nr:phosphoenolpyruvate carboxykinase [Dictyocaulus viviparus]
MLQYSLSASDECAMPFRNWLCHTARFFLCHRLEANEIWSYGSTFGENAFLSKKALGLRLASFRGWKEGWLAVHAALIAIKGPSGKEVFGCVSLPKGAGKTEVATMISTLKGWQIRFLGDDVVWIMVTPDRKLYALAPENGIFACPDNSTREQNPNMFKMLSKDAILVNCATTNRGRFFWDGLENFLEENELVKDWKNEKWTIEQKRTPSHVNCHYTVFTSSAPNVHPYWELSTGVPLSFIVFGCKRTDQMPLVYETESWEHGVTMAAGIRTISHSPLDKPTSALVPDPMCMRTYFSFGVGQYVKHWLNIKENLSEKPTQQGANPAGSSGKSILRGDCLHFEMQKKDPVILELVVLMNDEFNSNKVEVRQNLNRISYKHQEEITRDIQQKEGLVPKIFMVNWYQEDKDGKRLWPGFGENIRVFEWIVKRCVTPQETAAIPSAIGLLPKQLNVNGLRTNIEQLLYVDNNFWTKEIRHIFKFLENQLGVENIPIINQILTNISNRVTVTSKQ